MHSFFRNESSVDPSPKSTLPRVRLLRLRKAAIRRLISVMPLLASQATGEPLLFKATNPKPTSNLPYHKQPNYKTALDLFSV